MKKVARNILIPVFHVRKLMNKNRKKLASREGLQRESRVYQSIKYTIHTCHCV